MKILSALGELSGSFGDITASRNKGGQYFRFRARPTNPGTAIQQFVRNRLSALSKRWGDTLTDAQRASWENLAERIPVIDSLGQTRQLTGISMYIKINGRLIAAGEPIMDDAPIDQEVSSVFTGSILGAVGGTNTIDIAFAADCTADEKLYISAAINLSPGITYVKNLVRFAGVSPAAQVSNYVHTLPARFGNLITGQKLVVLVSKINVTTGAVSPPARLEYTAT